MAGAQSLLQLPTWDLAVSAIDRSGAKALILVEAKAHATELSNASKPKSMRKTQDAQDRTDANHQRIAHAIDEARAALQHAVRGIAISRNESYQFANRIAFAWKIASLGIPVALIYLGFVGDTAIAKADACLRVPADWHTAFKRHTASIFPPDKLERPIDCGMASFWLLVRDLPVLRQSPPLDQRRSVSAVQGPDTL